MSTWSMRGGASTGGGPAMSDLHDGDRAESVAVEPVPVPAAALPTLGQPGTEGLTNPGMAPLEVSPAALERNEAGVHHDAVGILDDDVAGPASGPIDLGPKCPSQSFCHGLDLVDGTRPPADDDAGFLRHFPRQAVDDRLAVGHLDDPPGRGPIKRPVPAQVLDK